MGFSKVGGIALNQLVAYKDKELDFNENDFKTFEKVASGYGNSHIEVIKDVFEALRNSKSPTITAESCLHTTKVVHAIYESSEKSDWVRVDDVLDYPKLGV